MILSFNKKPALAGFFIELLGAHIVFPFGRFVDIISEEGRHF